MNDLTLRTGGIEISPDSPEFEATACHLAREYQSATAAIFAHLDAIETERTRLHELFAQGEDRFYGFDLDIRSHGQTVNYGGELNHDKLSTIFRRDAWSILAKKLRICNLMSVKRRSEFDRQLESGELPEINEQTITAVLLGLVGQAQDFAKEAALEVFEILRPVRSEYKTNNRFRVGKRVILTWTVEEGYGHGKFRVNYRNDQQVTAIDGVFHLLAGKGPLKEHRGPLVKAIEESSDGKGATEFFAFKAFKNGNLHLEFKRLDLVKELNRLATGEHVLGCDQ